MISRYDAQEWLNSHAPGFRCSVCGGQNFGVAEDQLATTNSMKDKSGRIDYLSGFPLVVFTCGDCAQVVFFSAKQMGVL